MTSGRRSIGWVLAAATTLVLVALVPLVGHSAAAASRALATPASNSVTAHGAAPDLGGVGGSAPDVGVAATPDGNGYWLVGSDGGVFSYGDAAFHGSAGSLHLTAPIVAMAATPDGRGYWLVGSDGGVFSYGDATFHGSTGNLHLAAPVVGIAATPDGNGYWLVASDGGIFAFGDASFYGSMGGRALAQPMVAMAPAAGGHGYWLVASDGGIFAFGAAAFHGSLGNLTLTAPVTGMAATEDGGGYWMVGRDGGIFALGDAPFYGSDGGTAGNVPAVGMAARSGGYWIAYGQPDNPVPAIASYVASRADDVTVEVDDLANGQVYAFRPGVVEHTASTVKVDILATLLSEAQAQGRGLTAQEQADAVPMIEESDDDAADALWVEVGYQNVAGFERAAGMTSTVPPSNGVWGETTTTTADRIQMMKDVIFPNGQLTDASRAYILNLMEHITPSQDWGATGGVPDGVTVALKNGFSIINGWQINDEGWVSGDGRDYLIAMLSDENSSEAYGIQTLNSVSSIVWNSLGP